MMKTNTKHIPQRMCVVCRTRFNKRDLMRYVRTDSGIQVDQASEIAGRGVYICQTEACLQRALSSKMLGFALGTEMTDEDQRRIRDAVL